MLARRRSKSSESPTASRRLIATGLWHPNRDPRTSHIDARLNRGCQLAQKFERMKRATVDLLFLRTYRYHAVTDSGKSKRSRFAAVPPSLVYDVLKTGVTASGRES